MDITMSDYKNSYTFFATDELISEPWLIPGTVRKQEIFDINYSEWYRFKGSNYDGRTVCDSNGRIWKNGTAQYDYVIYAAPFAVSRKTIYTAATSSGSEVTEATYFGTDIKDINDDANIYKRLALAAGGYEDTGSILYIYQYMGEISDDIFNNIIKPDYEIFKPAPELYPAYEKLSSWSYYSELTSRFVDIQGLNSVLVENVLPVCYKDYAHMPYVPYKEQYDMVKENVTFNFPAELITDGQEHYINLTNITAVTIPTDLSVKIKTNGDFINVMEPYRMYFSCAKSTSGATNTTDGFFGCLLFPVLERRNV